MRDLVLAETRASLENDEPGTTLFVASTATSDRTMWVISQNWRLSAFRANPVILDNHDPMRVVGSATEAKVPKNGDDAGKLMIRVKWDLESPDPSIRNVGHQHLNGIRRAGSVGFRGAKRTRRDLLPKGHEHYQEAVEVDTPWGKERMSGILFENPELTEFSSATIPANAEALQRSLVELYRAEVDPAAPKDEPAEEPAPSDLLEFLSDPERRGKVLDLLLPDAFARIVDLLAPGDSDEDAPAEEPPADRAFRALWVPRLRSFIRSDVEVRRILRAVIDTGPPSAARTLTPRGDGLDFLFTERS